MGESNWSPKCSCMSNQLIGNNALPSLFPSSRSACNSDIFYTVLDKVVLLLANRAWPLPPRQGLVFQDRWSIASRVDEGELSRCFSCAWGWFFFWQSFIAPQLCNTPPDKNPAKATHGSACMSTARTRRVVQRLNISLWLFCSSPGMHRNRLPCDAAYPIYSICKIPGTTWFSSLLQVIFDCRLSAVSSVEITDMFLSVISSGCVSGQNRPFISLLSLWINWHLLRSRRAAWRVIDLLSGIWGMSLPGNQNESSCAIFPVGQKQCLSQPGTPAYRYCSSNND